jgi:FtsP/CotA-like multicopper oxidase with cupredoxin domain
MAGTAAISLAPLLPRRAAGAAGVTRSYKLEAGPTSLRLADSPFPETKLWCYNGSTPGPELRVKRGETLRVTVHNALEEFTGVHWHGLRIGNEMDGVAFLTQPPIEPGETFSYEFTPPDAGTFWYHSHENALVQQDMGLFGPLIVEEESPPQVDRELVWVLDDWRLDESAQVVRDFDSVLDYSRSGRLGNTVTLNGRLNNVQRVRAGERLRLRLINSANARIFQLRFQAHQPTVIALDGQPVAPFETAAVTLQNPFRLAEIVYEDASPLRESPLDAPIRLADNAIAVPDLSNPLRKDVFLEGGDLSLQRRRGPEGQQRGLSGLLLNGKFWAICGVSAFRQVMPPFVTVERGRTVVWTLKNWTAWPHTMHTHGHTFQVLEQAGRAPERRTLLDTIWLNPEEEATIAFVADNPGDWLFHCHMLSHAHAGMLATFRVS